MSQINHQFVASAKTVATLLKGFKTVKKNFSVLAINANKNQVRLTMGIAGNFLWSQVIEAEEVDSPWGCYIHLETFTKDVVDALEGKEERDWKFHVSFNGRGVTTILQNKEETDMVGYQRVLPKETVQHDFLTFKTEGITFEMPLNDWDDIWERISFAMGKNGPRDFYNGIYLHRYEDSLRGLATNGHKLAWIDVPIPEGAENIDGVIIPRDAVRAFSYWRNKFPQESCSSYFNIRLIEDYIHFHTDNMDIICKRINTSYPTYDRMCEGDIVSRVIVDAKKFTQQIKEMTPRNRANAGSAINFVIGNDEFRLQTLKNAEGYPSDLPAPTSYFELVEGNDSIEYAFRAKDLLDALMAFGGQVELRFRKWPNENSRDFKFLCQLVKHNPSGNRKSEVIIVPRFWNKELMVGSK